MYKDNSKYEMIKAKVANDWQVLEHVPEKFQTEELCMIAIEQSWEALNFVMDTAPKLCVAAWNLYYGKNEDTTALFRCVMKNLGYEEQESKKPVTTVVEMNNVIEVVKKLTSAMVHNTISVAKTAKETKAKLGSLLKKKKNKADSVEAGLMAATGEMSSSQLKKDKNK